MSDADKAASEIVTLPAATPLRRYHNLSLDQLWVGLMQLKTNAADMKSEVKVIDEELEARFGEFAAKCFVEDGKQHGQLTVGLSAEPKFSLKAEISKKVVWDSGMLEGIANDLMADGTLSWDDVRSLFKITFEMTEKMYSAIANVRPKLRELVDPARTVIYGDAPKLTLMRAPE